MHHQLPGLYTWFADKRLSCGSTFDKRISEQLMFPAQYKLSESESWDNELNF